MKRKFKLFATLASLCLSVALMAFGVYAATNSTYSISSSVSYTAQVACVWDAKVTKDGSVVTGMELNNANKVVVLPSATDAEAAATKELGAYEFSNAADGYIEYEVHCLNSSSTAAITVTCTTCTLPVAADNLTVTKTVTGAGASPAELATNAVYTVAASGELVVTVRLSVTDPAIGINSKNIVLAFSATSAAQSV